MAERVCGTTAHSRVRMRVVALVASALDAPEESRVGLWQKFEEELRRALSERYLEGSP